MDKPTPTVTDEDVSYSRFYIRAQEPWEEVIDMLSHGLTPKYIADQLGLSRRKISRIKANYARGKYIRRDY